ncbi:SpoU rRNA methylase family protein [Candidatus Mycoplasma haematolamae str. Purdue]|uniref:SpoU rRNA methylase family protein n=1 Tax=Mycoplasma haematolamae (strain Purdue) TaxID=1212765 RepID=I7C591_MYCHA|nr:23S rRNA (guanosine(2251)-2'-O)-methyltransferase RlmB [Candidatus Mycoplasma haematolamae]AFO51677.1 SpoU rRNA methylase family protein [Candidatus Mycoplasma haematolamae str. Purdue]
MKLDKKLVLNGKKSFLELLNQKELSKLIEHVYISSSQSFLISQCEEHNLPYSVKSKSFLSSLKKELNSKYSDVFAVLASKEQLTFPELLKKLSESQEPELIVMADKVQDPYNFGAVIRTCVGAGLNYLVYSTTNNVRLDSTVLKTSQGYAMKLNLIAVPNLTNALEKLKRLGFWSYGSCLSNDSKTYSSVEYSPRSVLVLGNEGQGISRLLESKVDWKISIPLAKEVDSLNVSVAAGILIYEYVRQLNSLKS